MRLEVVINARENFSVEDAIKHDRSCQKLENVLNSIQFYRTVMDANFDPKTTKGKTNQQIYDLIMSGAEELNPIADHEIDVWVKKYYKNNKVVGFTSQSTQWTNVNEKFFAGYTDAAVAGNLFHEWLHKIGLDHQSATDYDSVVYLLGYKVRDMIALVDAGALILVPMYHINEVETPAPVEPIVIKPKKYVCSRSWRNFFRKVCRYV